MQQEVRKQNTERSVDSIGPRVSWNSYASGTGGTQSVDDSDRPVGNTPLLSKSTLPPRMSVRSMVFQQTASTAGCGRP